MITSNQYFAGKPHNPIHENNFIDLIGRIEAMLSYLGYTPPVCPNTGTQISGSKGGSGDGGFRLQTATTGSGNSSHKEAKGIDIYDPLNTLDDMLTDEVLTKFNLYREAPESTHNWCHLTTRAPASGHRTFLP
jgi:hypothetical protein